MKKDLHSSFPSRRVFACSKNSLARKSCIMLFILLLSGTWLAAQITVTNATFPTAGTTLRTATATNPSIAISVAGPPGVNQVWDLSGLQQGVLKNTVFQSASQGTVGAQVPGAELFAVNSQGSEEYYNVTSNKFELQASYGKIYDVVPNHLFNYDPPRPYRHAPLNFFDIYQQRSNSLEPENVYIEGDPPNGVVIDTGFVPSYFPPQLIAAFNFPPGALQFLRYRVIIDNIEVVDAWGTMSIPGGTYNVLRLRRQQIRHVIMDAKVIIGNPTWIDITDLAIQAGFQGLGIDTILTYSFFNDVEKEPIAVVTLNREQNDAANVEYKYNPPACTAPTVTAPNVTQPTCPTPTGTIVVNATGGTLEYSVNNGTTWQASATFNGLAPGNYDIKVRTQSNPTCSTAYAGNPVSIVVSPQPAPPNVTANGSTILCTGQSVTLNANMPINNALSFAQANSQYITVPHSASINLGPTFTMEAWVNYSGQNRTILDKGDYDYLWELNPNTNLSKMGFYTKATGAWSYSTGTVPQNTWTHVAITLSEGTLTFYINGVASGTAAVTFSQDAQPMNIGRQQPTFCACNHFNGSMDELRLWNVLRTQTDIQTYMNTTVPTNSAGLVAYYKFDEGTGGSTADATINGNNGTFVNGPSWQVPATSPVNRVVWSPGGATTSAITVSTSGTYTATVTNGFGCTNATSTVVTAYSLAAPSLGADVTMYKNCFGETTDLNSLFNTIGLTPSWNTPNPFAAPPGMYRLIASNGVGCTDTAFANVILEVATWTGLVSNDWHNPANWNINKVPGEVTHVIVSGGTPNPCFVNTANAVAASIQARNGAIIQTTTGKNIMVNGKCVTLPPN